MIRIAALVLGASLMAGCQTMAEPEDDPGYNLVGERGPGAGEDGAPTCPAAAYQVLVGQQIGEIHTGSLPEPHRIYGRGDMVTMDYRPDRLNIVTGDDGAVVEVKCG